MSLLNKCQKQIALAIIASSGLALPADLLASDQRPISISSIMADLNLLDSKSSIAPTPLDAILEKSIGLLALATSDVGGLDVAPGTYFIDANNADLIKLKNLLNIDGDFASAGALEEIQDFAGAINILNERLYPGVTPLPDFSSGSVTPPTGSAVQKADTVSADYLAKIQELQKLIHAVDAHLDLSSSVPDLNFENILYGENNHNTIPDTPTPLEGALKTVYIPKNLASNYPVADLIWPASGKPDNIKLRVEYVKSSNSITLVNEITSDGSTAVEYAPNNKSLGSINLIADHALGYFTEAGGLHQVVLEYTLLDEYTGKTNILNLIVRYINPETATRSMSRAITGAFDILTANPAVPIYVSSANGGDLDSNQHWVTPEVFNAVNESLNEAVKIVMNVYKDTQLDAAAAGGDFQTKFETPPAVGFSDMSLSQTTVLPDETSYDFAKITGTKENYSTLEDLTQAINNLERDYQSYIDWGNRNTGTATLKGDVAKANLPLEIAKAMLGLKMVSAPIPPNSVNPFDFHMYEEGFGLPPSPVYLYVRKAQADDDLANEKPAIDPNRATGAVLGEYILTDKDNAENILAYTGTPMEVAGIEGTDYFVGAVICDEPYLVGTEEIQVLDPAASAGSTLPKEIKTKYLTTEDATKYLNLLKPFAAELDKYNGTDQDGNILQGDQYLAELKAGSAQAPGGSYPPGGIYPPGGGVGPSKLDSVLNDIFDFTDSIPLKEGQQHKKEEAINDLRKLLMYLGYAKSGTVAGGGNIFELLDPTDATAWGAIPLEAQTIANGVTSSNLTSKEPAFDLAANDDPLAITPRTAFYDISDVAGIDITAGNYWVSDEARNNLVAAATRAHNLLHSEYITFTKEEIADSTNRDYDTNKNPNLVITEADYKFYDTDLVKAEVQALSDALAAYDNAAKLSNFNSFTAMLDILATFKPTAENDFYTPAVTNADGLITTQRQMNFATANTFISNDGIYAVTREILGAGKATGEGISNIENVQLITGLAPTATSSTHFYVSAQDVDKLDEKLGTFLKVVALETAFDDYDASYVDPNLPNFPTDAKAIAKLFEEGKLSALSDGVNDAITEFKDKRKPIIPFAATRGDLQTAITNQQPLVQTQNGVVFLDPSQSDKVISDDNGYSWKKYAPKTGSPSEYEWVESTTFTSGAQWISSADLRTFYMAIEKAEKVIAETLPTAYGINPNSTATLADDTANLTAEIGELADGTKYASVKFNQAAYNKIVTAFNVDPSNDYFSAAENELATAKSTFDAAFQSPNSNAATAKAKYDAFKLAVGASHTNTSVVATQGSDGYVLTTGLTSAGTGIKGKVYGIQPTATDEITDYFPVGIYVVDDYLGVVNPLTNQLYGIDSAGSAISPAAPTQFVHIDAANEFIAAIESIDKFLDKPISDHFIAYENNPAYFDNALAGLEAAEDKFDAACKNTQTTAYVAAYKAIQNAMITSATTLHDNVAKFTPENDSTDVVALKVNSTPAGTGVNTDIFIIGAKTDILLDAVYKESSDGVHNTSGTALTTSDYWVRPEMFAQLQDAIWNVNELVKSAATPTKTHIVGYVADPTNYFANQVKKIGLDDAVSEFKLVKFKQNSNPNTLADIQAWIKEAQIILYGESSAGVPDGLGGTGDAADANVSLLTDGFDVLTLGLLKQVDTDPDDGVLNQTELDSITDDYYYFEKDYIDALSAALAIVDSKTPDDSTGTSTATQSEADKLIELVGQQYENRKTISVFNNAKIDLYKSYVETKAKLKFNGREILPSNNKGANISTSDYWVPEATLNTLKNAIQTTEDLLNNTSTEKAREAIFITQLKNQITINSRSINFTALPGTASTDTMTDLTTDKAALLAEINRAAALGGSKPYGLVDNRLELNESGVTSDLAIVVSTIYGSDVIGQDRDGNFVPDSGDRWTTAGALTAINRSITTAVNAYNNASATSVSVNNATNTLTNAINVLENGAKYGTLSTYQTVVNNMTTYINNVTDGNVGYSGSGADAAPIIKLDEIETSSVAGADVPPSKLWSTSMEITKLERAVETATEVITERANLAAGIISIDLPQLVTEMNKLKTAYENFYGRDINGQILAAIKPKALPGTDGVETIALKTLISDCVAIINNVVYLPGANRPNYTYTKFDGTPLNYYIFDRCVLTGPSPTYVNETDANGDPVPGASASTSDTHISSKAGGVDVPGSREWTGVANLNKLAQSVNTAQLALDRFESTDDSDQNQATLDAAVLVLETAKLTYENTLSTKTAGSAEIDYNGAYRDLYIAVSAAYDLIGKSGEPIPSYQSMVNGKADNIAGKTIYPSATNDGGDVQNTAAWVSTVAYNNYLNSVKTASDMLKNPTAVTTTLEKALTTLNTATANLKKVAKVGKADDKTSKINALNIKITDANNLINGDSTASGNTQYPLAESNNGTDISASRNWTMPNLYTALVTALTNAKNTQANLSTATLANLDTVTANLTKALTAIGTPRPGTLTAGSDSEEASIAKSELKVAINEAAMLMKTKTSANHGTDVTDGVNWVTTETIDEFEDIDGVNAAATPITFIKTAYNTALTEYNKNHGADQSVREAAYDTAKAALNHAIAQFNNVMINCDPVTGVDWAGPEPEIIGGTGTLNDTKIARAVLKERIDLITDVVRNTVEASDPDDVLDGRYYADSSDIGNMQTALDDATAIWRDTKKSEKELTYGSTDGNTVASDRNSATPAIPVSALGTLNGAYELFTGVNDNCAGTNQTLTGSDPIHATKQRQLKGILNAANPEEVSPVGLAKDIVIELFTVAASIPTIPVNLVLDTNGAVESALSAGNQTKVQDYIQELIENAINNSNVTVAVTLSATAGDYTAPTDIATGSIENFTVVLTEPGNTVANKWTIHSATTISSTNPEFETLSTTLEVNIAKPEEKWNNITKADIFNAATLITVAASDDNDPSVLDVDHYAYDSTLDPTTDIGKNTQVIAKTVKRQIEELIDNPAIEVTICKDDASITTGVLTSTDLTAATDDDAIKKAPKPATSEEEEGEAGEFEFKVKLSIPYDKTTAQASRALDTPDIESDLIEVTDESGSGGEDGTDPDFYTVLMKDAITIEIEPKPYVQVASADTIAVAEAKKAVTSDGSTLITNLAVTNTLEKPGNTLALANAQISEQVNTLLLTKQSYYDPELTKKVTFEIVEDLTDTGFTEPGITGIGTPAVGTYKFKIRFKQGDAELTTDQFDITSIAITPVDATADFKNEIENFVKFTNPASGTKLELTDINAFTSGEAIAQISNYINGKKPSGVTAAINVAMTAFKAPTKSTATKFGTNGSITFVVTFTTGSGDSAKVIETFPIFTNILATEYVAPARARLMGGRALGEIVEFESESELNYIDESFEEELFVAYDEEFVAEDCEVESFEEEIHEIEDMQTFEDEFQFEVEEFEFGADEVEVDFESEIELEEAIEEEFEVVKKNEGLKSLVKNLFARLKF